MRKGYYIMQSLVVGAIVANLAMSDLVRKGEATTNDIPSAIVIVVMIYVLWSNRRALGTRPPV